MSKKFHDPSLDEVVDRILERAGIWCGTCRAMRIERLLESGILEQELIGEPFPGASERGRHLSEETTSEGRSHRSHDKDETSD